MPNVAIDSRPSLHRDELQTYHGSLFPQANHEVIQFTYANKPVHVQVEYVENFLQFFLGTGGNLPRQHLQKAFKVDGVVFCGKQAMALDNKRASPCVSSNIHFSLL